MAQTRKHALITNTAQLRERCEVDRYTLCWHWLGAESGGTLHVWAFDHARCEKRAMSGPLAAWNIAHGEAPPPGALVYRCCSNRRCLNPVHLRLARSKAEIGLHMRRSGSRVGTALESRRSNIAKAHAANGITPTERAIVLAVRAAPADVTGADLAARYGMSQSTVSRIRRGDRHREVTA